MHIGRIYVYGKKRSTFLLLPIDPLNSGRIEAFLLHSRSHYHRWFEGDWQMVSRDGRSGSHHVVVASAYEKTLGTKKNIADQSLQSEGVVVVVAAEHQHLDVHGW